MDFLPKSIKEEIEQIKAHTERIKKATKELQDELTLIDAEFIVRDPYILYGHPYWCRCGECQKTKHKCIICESDIPDCDWDGSDMCVDCYKELKGEFDDAS